MDLTELIGKLWVDLEDDGTLFTTATLTRCIERAVDEMSRHLPRESIYEHTWVKAVTDDSFTTPAALDTDKVVDAMDLPNTVVDGSTATIVTNTGTWMDVPRPVYITITDANNTITRMTIIVKGTNADGQYVEERFYRQNGKLQTGKVYFSSIYEVEINEITGNVTGDTLDIGTATGFGLWVQLDNPIEPGSESIYSEALKAGTGYTKDTDYQIDYANGRINIISGGSMVEATTYYANYNRAKHAVDISSIIPQLIRIARVEYPVDKTPQQFPAWTIWENMLYIGSQKVGSSQSGLTDKEHIAIYYESKHSPPSLVSGGSYPEYLDEVVAIGAAAYAYLTEAGQYEQQAATDLASARTQLGLIAAVHILAAAASAKVVTYLETNGTTDNAKDVLANITDDIAELRTKIITAIDAAAYILAQVTTIDLDKATTGGEAYLDTGDDTIPTVNLADNVPENYALYGRVRTEMAQARIATALGFIQESQLRVNSLLSYVTEAGGWMRIAEDFIAEAQARIAEIDRYLAEAAQYQETANLSMTLSDRFRVEGQNRLDEFLRILSNKAEYRKRVASVPVRQPA